MNSDSLTKDPGLCGKCGWSLQQCDCCGLCGEPNCDCAKELNGDTSEPLGDFDDDDYELDEFEEAMYDCHGHFDEQGPGGIFQCGAVGSEDCDECPMHAWLGLTNRQIDRLEGIE